MLRRDSGIHPHPFRLLLEFLPAHPVDLRSRETPLPVPGNSKLPRNGKCRIHVIAGDHYRVHMGPLKAGYGAGRLLPWRIHHSHKAKERHILLVRQVTFGLHCDGKHPQGSESHILHRFLRRLSGSYAKRSLLSIHPHIAASVNHLVRRTLYVGDPFPVSHMYRGHALSLGVKRLLLHSRYPLLELFLLYSKSPCQIQQRKLRGVSQPRIPRNGVITQCARLQKKAVSVRRKLFPAEKSAVRITLLYRHSVLSQCSGLVRTDHAHRTKRLHTGEPAHNGIYLYHPGYAESQHDGHYGRKPLRHRRNSEGNCGQQHISDISFLHHGNQKQKHADPHGRNAENLPQIRQPFLQRGQFVPSLLDKPGNLSDLRLHSSGRYNPHTPSIGYGSGHERHIMPISQPMPGSLQDLAALFRRHGLPCQS